jgi:hypothetical protein
MLHHPEPTRIRGLPSCTTQISAKDSGFGMSTDAKSYRHRDPDKVIATQEREKKRKYLGPCLEQRRHFTPFVCSTDGLLGQEASTFAKRLAVKLANKW